jgi:outer membrane immunogenic protein
MKVSFLLGCSPRARAAAAKKFRIAITVTAALSGTHALGADLAAPVPAAVPYTSWSGPYAGLGLGARYNAVDGNVTSATVGTPPTPISLPTVSQGVSNPLEWWASGPGAMQYVDHVAFRIGFYGGWNFQVAPAWVVGWEGDFALANESAVVHGSPYPANLIFGTPSLPFGASPSDEFRVTTMWDGSARARAGWLANPSTLLYVTAGFALAHIQAESRCSTDPTANVSNCAPGNYFSGLLGPAVITHSATRLGWTAGGGIDILLAPQWVARAQYRFADFGYPAGHGLGSFSFTDTRACSGCAAANSPLTVSYQLPLMQHTFEFGLAYKFGQ